MKYYVSKPKSHKLNETMITGIKHMDSDAVFVNKLCEADICVMQHGWTKSKLCVKEYHLARELKITRREGYLYTDKYKAKIN